MNNPASRLLRPSRVCQFAVAMLALLVAACTEDEADPASSGDANDSAPSASDAFAPDALGDGDAATEDANVECWCSDPVGGACDERASADTGTVVVQSNDGTSCLEVGAGPFFCNNGCGAPGVNEMWFDGQEHRYVLFAQPPCATDLQRWRRVDFDSTEYETQIEIFNAPYCSPTP